MSHNPVLYDWPSFDMLGTDVMKKDTRDTIEFILFHIILAGIIIVSILISSFGA